MTTGTETAAPGTGDLSSDVAAAPAGWGGEIAAGTPAGDQGITGMGSNKTDLVNQLLGTVGLGLQAALAVEQHISAQIGAVLPYPALPAMRMNDMALGIPHPHLPVGPVPPFGPIFRFLPLPQPGFYLSAGFLSGAGAVTINGRPACRVGDMGLHIPACLSFVPVMESFLGSANVWIEGQRAARLLDVSLHCTLFDPPMGIPLGAPGLNLPLCSGDVLVGGFPMPSLLDMAIGVAFEVALRGVRGILRAYKGARRAFVARYARVIAGNLEKWGWPYFRHWARELTGIAKGSFVFRATSILPFPVQQLGSWSKRFCDDVTTFFDNGGRWKWGDPKNGTFISGTTIQVSKDYMRRHPIYMVGATVHEIGHSVWNRTFGKNMPNPDDFVGNYQGFRDAYVYLAKQDEGFAVAYEFSVMTEIAEGTGIRPDFFYKEGVKYAQDPYELWQEMIDAGWNETQIADALGNQWEHLKPSGDGSTTYLDAWNGAAERAFGDRPKTPADIPPPADIPDVADAPIGDAPADIPPTGDAGS